MGIQETALNYCKAFAKHCYKLNDSQLIKFGEPTVELTKNNNGVIVFLPVKKIFITNSYNKEDLYTFKKDFMFGYATLDKECEEGTIINKTIVLEIIPENILDLKHIKSLVKYKIDFFFRWQRKIAVKRKFWDRELKKIIN